MTTPSTGEFRRDDHAYRDAKADFRDECSDLHEPCWLCHRPINYDLEYPHPESFSVDHAKTVKDHPELGGDPLNFRPSHLVCNQRRGDEDPHIDIGTPSEVW